MISLLVINYRSAAIAAEAIRSARAASSSTLQVVVVDNSMDAGEADQLRPYADAVLAPDKNLGYAGGINAGRPQCSGEVIVVSNPDVVFGPSSIDELVRALTENDAAAAGPALFWDDAFAWMLPPGELHTATEKLDEALASRSSWWSQRRDRRRIGERLAFWSLTKTTGSRAISGAVMAIRAADMDAAGGFDERFSLYFEENDFLRRIAANRKRIVYVPAARCRHLYNQSAGAERARTAAAYAQSELIYLAKWNGRRTAALLKAIERPRRVPESDPVDGPIWLPEGDLFIEASPMPSFDTAAGHFPRAPSVDIPREVWQSYRSAVLYLRAVDRRTRRVVKSWARYGS